MGAAVKKMGSTYVRSANVCGAENSTSATRLWTRAGVKLYRGQVTSRVHQVKLGQKLPGVITLPATDVQLVLHAVRNKSEKISTHHSNTYRRLLCPAEHCLQLSYRWRTKSGTYAFYVDRAIGQFQKRVVVHCVQMFNMAAVPAMIWANRFQNSPIYCSIYVKHVCSICYAPPCVNLQNCTSTQLILILNRFYNVTSQVHSYIVISVFGYC